jgi:hypothetical protein
LGGLFYLYTAATPGTDAADNVTHILDDANEFQADLFLRILPAWRGHSRNTQNNRYILGGPELAAEIADTTRCIDLGLKRAVYERMGVQEYAVASVEERSLYWFDFASKTNVKPNRQGVWKSRVFPGLWVVEPALWDGGNARLIEVLQQGLAHRSHAAFVRRLQKQRPAEGSES